MASSDRDDKEAGRPLGYGNVESRPPVDGAPKPGVPGEAPVDAPDAVAPQDGDAARSK